MSVFRTALCFAGFVFYLFFRQFFGSDAESAKPAPPASYQQLPSAEDDLRREISLGLEDIEQGRVIEWDVEEMKQRLRRMTKRKKAS